MLPAFVATWLIAAFFLILPTPSGATPPSQACNNQADPVGLTSPVVTRPGEPTRGCGDAALAPSSFVGSRVRTARDRASSSAVPHLGDCLQHYRPPGGVASSGGPGIAT